MPNLQYWINYVGYFSLIDRNDIGPPASFDNLFRIINQVVPITGFAGPGAWNDLDLLEVGIVILSSMYWLLFHCLLWRIGRKLGPDSWWAENTFRILGCSKVFKSSTCACRFVLTRYIIDQDHPCLFLLTWQIPHQPHLVLWRIRTYWLSTYVHFSMIIGSMY